MSNVTGVLLVGGEAERLRPLTQNVPKASIQAGGRPLVEYSLAAFRHAGIERVIVVTGQHGSHLQATLGDGDKFGLQLEYVAQTNQGGTCRALATARSHIGNGDVILVYGNAWMQEDALKPLLDATGDVVMIAPAHSTYKQGIPTVQEGLLASVDMQKPKVPGDRVLTGMMRLTPEFLAFAEDCDDESQLERVWNRYASEHSVQAIELIGEWWTVDDPWSLLALNEAILLSKGEVVLGQNVTVSPTAYLIAPVHIADGSTIGDFSVVGPFVSIGQNSFIGAHCEVRRTIINDNVTVDSRALLRGSILDHGAALGPSVTCIEKIGPRGIIGVVVGADIRVDAGTNLHGGTVLGNEGFAE